ncbi:MAG: MurR/RpiR family transcriptional regulator, partial [Actinobacteria bacterium]|nr:MurR/RpiR family transcriptional regulator [Actinomycetota bacterium]
DSPLVTLADISLVVAPASTTFRSELEHTSRIALLVLVESLVEIVTSRTGDDALRAQTQVLEVLSDNLSD